MKPYQSIVHLSAAQNVASLLTDLNRGRDAATDAPIPSVVYPNSGETYSVVDGWTGKVRCQPLCDYVPEWVALGARYIGGCCRTYAADIERIAESVRHAELAAGNGKRPAE